MPGATIGHHGKGECLSKSLIGWLMCFFAPRGGTSEATWFPLLLPPLHCSSSSTEWSPQELHTGNPFWSIKLVHPLKTKQCERFFFVPKEFPIFSLVKNIISLLHPFQLFSTTTGTSSPIFMLYFLFLCPCGCHLGTEFSPTPWPP